MLYKRNSEPFLKDELFKNPTSEYRGTPFWAWNSHLEKKELMRQIEIFKEMGFGGFHMHVRTGLKNPYLSDEYMSLVKACVSKAKNESLLAWLYDEDRWPSGAAGGLAARDKNLRARALVFTTRLDGLDVRKSFASRVTAARTGNGTLLAAYDIILDKDGCLEHYRRIDKDEAAKGTKWYALAEIMTEDTWYNNQTYIDTLNKAAAESFIAITHERYKKTVGEEFDKTIPAIFTDEPQTVKKLLPESSLCTEDAVLPWTDSIPELYRKTYGADILDTLPELFRDLKNGAVSLHRYRYHDFISELFTRSFADTVGNWCKDNSIALTGHMFEEPTLSSQSLSTGEAMRAYRAFSLPGIDMLCDHHEFTTAKQAQSAAHQFGYEGVLSELYGVTGWECDFRTYKHQGDWQAALGVTVRVPHLSWYAMQGESKRDYPASISYQSPWHKEYRAIEDHFARLNTALTRGKPIVRLGVIHPVESCWLHLGPNDKSGAIRDALDEKFLSLTRWLLEGTIDFDFISESLLPGQCKNASAPLCVGEMQYDTVIVPACETLRSTTLERLEKFRECGGRLIFLGEAPSLCDAVKSGRPEKLFSASENYDFSRTAILSALEKERIISVRRADDRPTNNFIYQLRKDEDCKWLFLAHSRKIDNDDVDTGEDITITLKGEYSVMCYDSQSGSISGADFENLNGCTVIKEHIYSYDSLLYKLTEKGDALPFKKQGAVPAEPRLNEDGAHYELSENNVLLLDMAEYKLSGDECFSAKEEILRIDNICRNRLGLKERGGRVSQPWACDESEPLSEVTLKFTFISDIEYSGAFLALENADKAAIIFNGCSVKNEIRGYYTDISISKVLLPTIHKGENQLIVTYPFGEDTGLENMFILGLFGVAVTGTKTKIIPLPQKLMFTDIVRQGLPFYSGCVTYKIPVDIKDGSLTVTASRYRGALIKAYLDKSELGNIIYPPYTLTADNIKNGKHLLELKLFTDRYNTFGPLHLVKNRNIWKGPDCWRSKGPDWSYEYIFKQAGIIKSPDIN